MLQLARLPDARQSHFGHPILCRAVRVRFGRIKGTTNMIIFVGTIIVFASVLGGFVMGGGNVAALLHVSELIIIAGAALGALIIMSPKKVLVDLGKLMMQSIKGAPYGRSTYDELLKALYELFLL